MFQVNNRSNQDSELNMFAHIPQDFNLDLEVNGHIQGVNLGDSKFLGTKARFVTSGEDGQVRARRVRADDCEISTVKGQISIGSYIDAYKLNINTQGGNVNITKRLGINGKGIITQSQT